MFVTVVGFLLVLLTGGTHAFQLPKRVHARVIQPSFHRPSSLQMAAVKASSAVVVSPNVLKQFMAASVKNKVIVGAHAVAVVAILWLLKWILVAIQTTFFGKKEISKVAKGEKRFYGISRPLKSVPVQNPLSDPVPKKRVTVASVASISTTAASSTTSLAQAKAQVINILESLDQATIQAKHRVEQSITTIMGRDPEQVARDIYIAKIKQAEKERLAKLAKAKAAAEAELATQERARKAVENRIMMENQKATLESQQRQAEEVKRMAEMKVLDKKRLDEEASMIQANKTRMNAAVQSAATEVAMQAQQASKKSGWSPHAMVRT